MALTGYQAVKAMDAIHNSNDFTSEESVATLFQIAIDGNIAQLKEQYIFDEETIEAGIHRTVDEYALDEYANTNSDLYNMINAAMRTLLMVFDAKER